MNRTKALLVAAGVVAAIVVVVILLRLTAMVPHDTAEVVYPDPRDRTSLTLDLLRQHLRELRQGRRPLPASIDDVARGDSAAGELTKDAWARKIRLTHGASGYELRSAGPNGRFGDLDDVVDVDTTTAPPAAR